MTFTLRGPLGGRYLAKWFSPWALRQENSGLKHAFIMANSSLSIHIHANMVCYHLMITRELNLIGTSPSDVPSQEVNSCVYYYTFFTNS